MTSNKVQYHRLLCILCAAAAFADSGAAQSGSDLAPNPAQPAPPRLVCPEPRHDFGTAESGTTVKHSFVLRNAGGQPLEIRKIKADCSCTVARSVATVIPPDGETKLEVELSLKGLQGRQEKRVMLHSNDPEKPIYVLVLEGEAIKGVEVEPDRIYLGTITLDSDAAQIINIKCRMNGPFNIIYTESTLPQFQLTVEPVKKGWEYRVRAVAAVPFPRGAIKGSILVWTDHPDFKRIEIPVYGRAISGIYTIPDEFILDPMADAKQSRLMVVRSADGANFKILDITPPDKETLVTVSPMSRGAYRLELRFTQRPELDGKYLAITTDAAKDNVLHVPFRFQKLMEEPPPQTTEAK